LAPPAPGEHFRFERLVYFCVDKDSTDGALIFNRTVSLKDPWAKNRKGQQIDFERPK
jgi:glutaminyl-tRNA synthetase